VLHNSDIPGWLLIVASISLALGVACAVLVAADIARHPQPMRVMNVVWPVCALFGSVLWAAAYFWWGRAQRPAAADDAQDMSGMDMSGMDTSSTGMPGMKMSSSDMSGMDMPGMDMRPALGLSGRPHSRPVSVFVGTSHCGAGCSLADLIVEWTIFAVPSVAVVGGLHWLFSDELYAGWVIAYVVALIIGIAFQFFAIAPMNPQRGVAANVAAAAKADVLSLSAWQIGMYGAMAVAQLAVFPAWLGDRVAVDTPVFWLTMQVAMLAGFCTAYPVNWWLIRAGVKEAM